MGKKEKIDILTQPLLTEEGYLNEACMNELKCVINNFPKPHERNNNDEEWVEKNWIFRKEIVSVFAMCAIRQSPYVWPDDLEKVVKYLDACLTKSVDWEIKESENDALTQLSLSDISKLLYSILYEQNFQPFDKWNKSKIDIDQEISFVSICDVPKQADYDFMDLDALLNNVCITIRDKIRKDKEFDRKFEEEHGEIS